jgi:hypothetical protein
MRLAKIDRLVTELFKQKWSLLHENDALKDERLKYPGVYLLAYTGRKIVGKKVDCDDVFYVGMSNSAQGVRDRLKQFKAGIENGVTHSAAIRFYRDHSGSQPFSTQKGRRKFYFAAQPINCVSDKGQAEPIDFRELGHVTCLEYYAIAHVLEKRERTPPLNKLGNRSISA